MSERLQLLLPQPLNPTIPLFIQSLENSKLVVSGDSTPRVTVCLRSGLKNKVKSALNRHEKLVGGSAITARGVLSIPIDIETSLRVSGCEVIFDELNN